MHIKSIIRYCAHHMASCFSQVLLRKSVHDSPPVDIAGGEGASLGRGHATPPLTGSGRPVTQPSETSVHDTRHPTSDTPDIRHLTVPIKANAQAEGERDSSEAAGERLNGAKSSVERELRDRRVVGNGRWPGSRVYSALYMV